MTADMATRPYLNGDSFASLPVGVSSESYSGSGNSQGLVYDEQAFRYFLDIERKRSERSSRPFLLLLVDLEDRSGSNGFIDPAVAAKLFEGLGQCVRETDFVGWFREGRVAGAVLTQYSNLARTDVAAVVDERVREVLSSSVPIQIARSLRMRAYWIPSHLERRG
jgi:hypothetical protein